MASAMAMASVEAGAGAIENVPMPTPHAPRAPLAQARRRWGASVRCSRRMEPLLKHNHAQHKKMTLIWHTITTATTDRERFATRAVELGGSGAAVSNVLRSRGNAQLAAGAGGRIRTYR